MNKAFNMYTVYSFAFHFVNSNKVGISQKGFLCI